MSSLLEQCRCLGAHQHRTLVLPDQRGARLRFSQSYEKPAVNPKTGASVTAQRRRLAVIEELPAREAYATWLQQLISTIEMHHGAH